MPTNKRHQEKCEKASHGMEQNMYNKLYVQAKGVYSGCVKKKANTSIEKWSK